MQINFAYVTLTCAVAALGEIGERIHARGPAVTLQTQVTHGERDWLLILMRRSAMQACWKSQRRCNANHSGQASS